VIEKQAKISIKFRREKKNEKANNINTSDIKDQITFNDKKHSQISYHNFFWYKIKGGCFIEL
jgi:hypothetical protein